MPSDSSAAAGSAVDPSASIGALIDVGRYAERSSSASSTSSTLAPSSLRQLRGGRLPAEARGERGGGPTEPGVQVLEAAGHMDRPGGVAKVPAQLAGDRRPGVCAERDADRRVVSLDRLEHAEAGDLEEVVHRLATAGEAHRFTAGEVEVQLDQLVAQPLVTGSTVLAERLEHLRRLSFHW